MAESLVCVQTLKEEVTNSIKPSIVECERFILFLNKTFNLNLTDNLIVNIQDTKRTIKGFFMPKEHKNHYNNTHQTLNYICISSLFLKDNPYEVIAHGLAHFLNAIKGYAPKSNYHTKHFKEEAEKLLLKVEKGNYGFNVTSTTEEFKQLLNDFKPNKEAFKVYQNKEESVNKSRNILFMCDCGVKIRTAKNDDKPLKAVCLYCNSEFKLAGVDTNA